jgi:hypothetical protein
MSGKSLLTTKRRTSDAGSTPDQERFRYLIAQIETLRKARSQWDAMVLAFRQADMQRLQPLRATLRAATRETVFAIDRLLEGSWSRADRAALEEILCGTAQILLEADPNDADVKAAYDRHSAIGFDAARRAELEDLKEQAQEYMGVDLEDAEIENEEDLIARLHEHMAEREKRAQEARQAGSRGRRKSAAQQRVEASAQAAKKFLREIYRKLASAVHPDREADEARRTEKNELMQRINRAYATNDLLTLLEAQLRLEQIDPEHVAKLSGERLKHYNRLLSEQLEGAKAELRQLEEAFRAEHGMAYGKKVTQQTLHLLSQQRARELRTHIARQKHFLEVLASKAAIKRWLKEQRRFDVGWEDED